MSMYNIKRNILKLTAIFFILFAFFTAYVIYLQLIQSASHAHNPLDSRNSVLNDNIVRGAIYDNRGRILAKNGDDGARYYPFGEAMAFVTGYADKKIGTGGAESYFNQELSGKTKELTMMGPIGELLRNNQGNDLILTVDSECQQAAFDALEGRRGAVVVLDATTGAILALVSSPAYNPNRIVEEWSALNEGEDHLLLNRAINGLYPPGSIIKPMIVDMALENAVTDEHELFTCGGFLDVGGGFSIKEAHDGVHGNLHLKDALVESCNVTFGTLAIRLGADNLEKGFKRYGFYEPIRGEIFESASHIPEFKTLDKGDIAQIGIGQSMLLVTPIRMALIASSIANDGVMMEPYLLEKIISSKGIILNEHKKKELSRVMTKERAGLLKNWMEEVVLSGTGKAAKVSGIRVAGKTGTAENSSDKEHSWFIGFAELEKRKIAFAILIENGGSGADTAAPIARKLILSFEK
ncbi:MAG: cell division protein FtsI [Selenomonadaceae bacterium]|nr:cell division protein FtsI [Selenomonadaceae bacterium]